MDKKNDIHVIKKYKNRRLYDTNISRYITFEDLKQYILQTIEFQIIDATSAKDLTNQTLLQVFVEMQTASLPFLSNSMLKQLIILNQHPMQAAVKEAFEQTLVFFWNQFQTNSYLADWQKFTDLWNQNDQTIYKKWQDIFAKNKS